MLRLSRKNAAMPDKISCDFASDFEGDALRSEVPDSLAGMRLDQVATILFPPYSRQRIQQWITAGRLQIDGQPGQRDQAVRTGQVLTLSPDRRMQQADTAAQDLQLRLVHEDEALFVIDKPAGLVCHPAPGHSDQTLVNGLLHLDGQLRDLPRAGLVHRLDRDTTGLLAIARTEAAWQSLSEQLRQRRIERRYLAIVRGLPTAGGVLDKAIGRHPRNRLRQAVRSDGKAAETHFKIRRQFRHHTELQVQLQTGRTHQIRVHLTDAGLPLVGDRVYGRGSAPVSGMSEAMRQAVRDFPRQALHAHSLSLQHPSSGKMLQWQSPEPQDYLDLRQLLRDDAHWADKLSE